MKKSLLCLPLRPRRIIWVALSIILLSPFIYAQTPDQFQEFDPGSVFTTIGGLAGAVLFITSWLKKKLNTKDMQTIIISIIVSTTLSYFGYVMQFGMFINVAWYYVFIYSFAAVLIANGASTWSVISKFLVFLKLKLPEQK